MAVHTQSLNEDRSARRAAELRRRFAHVSDASLGRARFGPGRMPAGRIRSTARSRRAQLQEFLAWSMLAGAMIFIGYLIF